MVCHMRSARGLQGLAGLRDDTPSDARGVSASGRAGPAPAGSVSPGGGSRAWPDVWRGRRLAPWAAAGPGRASRSTTPSEARVWRSRGRAAAPVAKSRRPSADWEEKDFMASPCRPGSVPVSGRCVPSCRCRWVLGRRGCRRTGGRCPRPRRWRRCAGWSGCAPGWVRGTPRGSRSRTGWPGV